MVAPSVLNYILIHIQTNIDILQEDLNRHIVDCAELQPDSTILECKRDSFKYGQGILIVGLEEYLICLTSIRIFSLIVLKMSVIQYMF